ncbi:MAG: DUF2470 domain-containing protein [Deltaproteobacteria bacterium]|nr:DUF2470 domain-containing protein [Deltaproteobacteria bacterium]
MPPAGKTDITAIKTFVLAQRWGTLSTLSASRSGYPFGSLVPYDVDELGNVYIYVSLIAEHYKNLKTDPRASLMIIDPFGIADPQAHARATVLLDFEKVPQEAAEPVQSSYEQRFPNSINYEIAHNFLFMKGAPKEIRWIGGFGDIQWVKSEEFSNAAPDLLARDSHAILTHMNEDHRDAVRDFVLAATGQTCQDAQMTAVHVSGFTIRHGKSLEHSLDIPFVVPIRKPDEVRSVMVKTLAAARAKITGSSN